MFYDVNSPEGFNLRRDVYIRYAVFAHKLKKAKDTNLHNFKLVLPPWSNLYHWKLKKESEQLFWSLFFDLPSLQSFAPVIEMHHFFDGKAGLFFIFKLHLQCFAVIIHNMIILELDKSIYTKIAIDDVYVLQHFEDMFDTGNFEERMQIEKCHNNKHDPSYFFYSNITSNNIKCLSFHGHASQLADILKTSSAK